MLTLSWQRKQLTRGRMCYSLQAQGPCHGEFQVCAYELPPGWPAGEVWALVKRDASLIKELIELHAHTAAKKHGRRA